MNLSYTLEFSCRSRGCVSIPLTCFLLVLQEMRLPRVLEMFFPDEAQLIKTTTTTKTTCGSEWHRHSHY